MKIDGARVLLTGASGGIGQALAQALHASGASLLLHGHHRVCSAFGPDDKAVQADLSSADGQAALVKSAEEFDINLLINNAGVNDFCAYEAADPAQLIATNVIAPMLLTQALLPHLRRQPEARIVNMGSTFGEIGYPGYVAYCTSKHALRGFSQALRRELADSSVGVLHVSPRATRTNMNDARVLALNEVLGTGMDEPERLAEQVVRSIATDKSCLQMGAMEKIQVAMNRLFPGVVDGALKKQLSIIKKYYLKTEESLL